MFFTCLGKMLRNGIGGSYGNCVRNFLLEMVKVLAAPFMLPQQCMKLSVYSYLLPYLLFVAFLVIAILVTIICDQKEDAHNTSTSCYKIVVLI